MLTAAIAPAFTIGFTERAGISSIASFELKGRPVGSTPIFSCTSA